MGTPLDLNPLKIDRGAAAAASQRRRRGRGRLVGWLVTLAVAVAAVWLFRRPIQDFVDGVRLPVVEVVRVTRTSPLAASAVTGTAASGYVVASRRAALSADTPGRIVEMNVEEGSVVREGDVVARLYSAEYEAALRAAEADLASGRVTVSRMRAESDVAGAEVERLVSSVTAAQARQAEAEAAAELATVQRERFEALVAERIESQSTLDEAVATEDQARAAVDAAVADVASAQKALAHARSRLVAATAAVAESEARLPVLEATRDQARATLDKTEVRAPFDGIVVLKDAEVGEVVSPNSMGGNSRGSVATMVDFASLEVQVDMPETSLSAVVIGEPANIYLDAFPRHLYTGTVQRIWPTANRQKATVEVRVGFDETDERLRPEMGARVVFSPETGTAVDDAGAEERILVPLECVVRIDSRPGVFVLERDVVRFRELALGAERSGRVLIEDGLVGGESIVSDPPASLADGDRVRTQE